MMKFLSILFLILPIAALAQPKSFEVGDTLPDFSYQGTFQKPYHLKDLKGSFVLIHFWASWNTESRRIQREMSGSYIKFKDKKFKKGRKFYLISVSIDEDIKYNDLALKKDNLPWKNHACDQKGWSSPIITGCKINSIPANYLINPDGIIVAKNIDYQQLDILLRSY